MYFVNTTELTESLSRKPLSPRDGLNYLFGWFVLTSAWSMGSHPASRTSDLNPVDQMLLSAGLLAIIAAVARLIFLSFFKAHGEDEGQDFASNLIAVAFVINFQITVYALAPLYVFSTFGYFGLGELAGQLVQFIVWTGVAIYHFVSIRACLRRVRDLRARADRAQV